MKRIYSKPVLTVESFVTDEIMDNNATIYQEDDILSYNPAAGVGGYGTYEEPGFITFEEGLGNKLHSIDYGNFSK